jgi:tetratricopeptide (TPR) repeat protein
MKLISVCIVSILLAGCISTKDTITSDVDTANNLFKGKEYAKSLVYYKKLSQKTKLKGFYQYMTARCYAETGNWPQCEKYLKKSIGYSPFYFEKYNNEANNFEAFNKTLYAAKISSFGEGRIKKVNWKIDSILLKELEGLSASDQLYRKQIIAAAKNGDKSRYDSLGSLQKSLDTLVRIKFLALIEKKFPDMSNVGQSGTSIAMSLIQHLPIEKQKALLPVVKKHAKKHFLSYISYVNLYDRIQMQEGKCQKYGTQQQIKNSNTCIYCIKKTKNVNYRRAKIGLQPIDSKLPICSKSKN